MQARFIFANGAIGASWTNFMGQVEHGLRFAMAQNIDRRPKHFALVASQLVNAYIKNHN